MKCPYNRIMLALSYMRGSMTIWNWVKHEMKGINTMTSITARHLVPYESE
jgi:hypothetical protein